MSLATAIPEVEEYRQRTITPEDLKPLSPPNELLRLCPEAATLWQKLFRNADFNMLYNFGIEDLMFRFRCQVIREQRRNLPPDYRQRAHIWYHVNAASALGGSEIPDLTESNILAWMPDTSESKKVSVDCLTCGKRFQQKRGSEFASCLTCRSARVKAKQAKKSAENTGALPEGWKLCTQCNEPFQPERTDAVLCNKQACKAAVAAKRAKDYRERKKIEESVLAASRTNAILTEIAPL
jgi:hypothetical protein